MGVDQGADHAAVQAVVAVAEVDLAVGAQAVGVAAGEVAVGAPDAGAHEAQAVLAAGELAHATGHGVAVAALAGDERVVHLVGMGDVGHRAKDADVGLLVELAGELGGGADAAARLAGADAPRVEEVEVGMLEEAGALHEEGPLLGIEGLEGRQVQQRRVGLHLAEVGLHGDLGRERAGEVVAQVGAQVEVAAVGLVGVVGTGAVLEAGGHVGRRLQTFGAAGLAACR